MDDIKAFEQVVENHSLFPRHKLYNAVGLAGEVGELLNIVKKIAIRYDLLKQGIEITSMKSMTDYELDIEEELGDTLFYLIRLAKDFDIDVEQIIRNQTLKLAFQTETLTKQEFFLK